MSGDGRVGSAAVGGRLRYRGVAVVWLFAAWSACDDGNASDRDKDASALVDAGGHANPDASDRLTVDAGDAPSDGLPDSGPAIDAEPPAANSCNPVVSRRVVWTDPTPDHRMSPAGFTSIGEQRFVGLWFYTHGTTTRTDIGIVDLREGGAEPVQTRELWDVGSMGGTPMLAASHGVLAVVDRGFELTATGGGQDVCRLGLVKLSTLEPIQTPLRYSDPPQNGSRVNSALGCAVAGLGDGFVLFWTQYVRERDPGRTVFAQRIGPDGELRGQRVTLIERGMQPIVSHRLVSFGDRVAVDITDEDAGTAGLVYIDAAATSLVPLRLPGNREGLPLLELTAAHDGMLARTLDSVWVLERDGSVKFGPAGFDYRAQVGPLGDGFVEITHSDFLTATSLSATLASRSKPLRLTLDAEKYPEWLLTEASDGFTAVEIDTATGAMFAVLGCGERSSDAPAEEACPGEPNPSLPGTICTDEVCHAVLRLDRFTLGVRGWAVSGTPAKEITPSMASEIAAKALNVHSGFEQTVPSVDGPLAGVYRASVESDTLGAVVAIGEHSGAVVFAGAISTNSPDGGIYTPTTWTPASDIVCGEIAIQPAATYLQPDADTACRSALPDTQPVPIADALDIALRSNLAASLAKRGPVSAHAFLYTPKVGGCSPSAAEYIVILTQVRP